MIWSPGSLVQTDLHPRPGQILCSFECSWSLVGLAARLAKHYEIGLKWWSVFARLEFDWSSSWVHRGRIRRDLGKHLRRIRRWSSNPVFPLHLWNVHLTARGGSIIQYETAWNSIELHNHSLLCIGHQTGPQGSSSVVACTVLNFSVPYFCNTALYLHHTKG